MRSEARLLRVDAVETGPFNMRGNAIDLNAQRG
jgi:hypothetical protein